MTKKLVSKREWLEAQKYSNSFYDLKVDTFGEVDITLSDCYRSITWGFGRPGKERGKAKIKKLKALVDALYNHIHEIKD